MHPDFRRLVAVRRRVTWSFLAILLGLYVAFGLLSVYYPAILARPVFADGVVPVGVAMGYLNLALTFVLTVAYVWIANAYLEPLERSIVARARAEAAEEARSR